MREATALLAKRRPRESHIAPVWGVHVLSLPQAHVGSVQHESSRERFLGRGRDARSPVAFDRNQSLSGATGLVLDPVFSLRCQVRIGRQAALDRLVSPTAKLVKLLSSPFDKTELEPGYIKGYVPGVRENGGQYTHAAIWLIQALAEMGRAEKAMDLIDFVNPVLHSDAPEGVNRYRVEPYVVAADVYSVSPHIGRGGWTWYTGSASWMYRAALETLLGGKVRGRQVHFLPRLPHQWSEYEVALKIGSSKWNFKIQLTENEEKSPAVELIDDGRDHRIEIGVNRRS